MDTVPQPIGGASLLVSWKFKPATKDTVLVVGSNATAASRVFASLDADARVVLVRGIPGDLCNELQVRVDSKQVDYHDREFVEEDLFVDGQLVNMVMVTTATSGTSMNDHILLREEDVADSGLQMAREIATLCRKHRIPINVTDQPDLCDFFMMATHRQEALQIGVCTNGQGCKLGSRIKRDIVSALPKSAGRAVTNVGKLKKRVREEYGESKERAKKRMVWLSNMSHYWPIDQLAKLTDKEMADLLKEYGQRADEGYDSSNLDIVSSLTSTKKKRGRIYLVGSGPGDPNLLTVAARATIDKATLILADKLVPSSIMDLIPESTPVHIARKFPGNADAAQAELHQLGVDALLASEKDRSLPAAVVVRLKQGDPYVFGRGGEEHLFFSQHGYEPVVIPGISSALAGPLLCNIPITHRGVADRFLVQTVTDRQGQFPNLPEYIPTQTTVLLMGLHKLRLLVDALIAKGWPKDVPAAVVERASCHDQRCVKSSLERMPSIMEMLGQRPPGLIIIGWAIDKLTPRTEVYTVVEGMGDGYDFAELFSKPSKLTLKMHEAD